MAEVAVEEVVREEQEVAAPVVGPGDVGEVLVAGPLEAEMEVQAVPGGRAVPAEEHGEGSAAWGGAVRTPTPDSSLIGRA